MRMVVVVAAFCAGGLNLWPQATQVSQIGGMVQDASGFAVPEAQVEVINTDTGIAHKVDTAPDGAYIVANLAPGPYRLAVTKTGFAPYQQSGIVLQVNTNPQ